MDLHAYQLTLLEAIFAPVVNPGLNDEVPTWPVWDYVARYVHQKHPDVDDALSLWRSLPVWNIPVNEDYGQLYGLTWCAGTPGDPPRRTSHVGLTIAGLEALGTHQPSAGVLAHAFVALIAAIAKADDGLRPTPGKAVIVDMPLAQFTSGLREPHGARVFAVPDALTFQVLRNEAAPVEVTGATTDDGPTVHLGSGRLRRFRSLEWSQEYVQTITGLIDDSSHQSHQSALPLIQTLDYLGHVLAAHPAWTSKRLTVAPDLESAAALSRDVSSLDEFQSAISALGTVVDQLNIPKIPRAELDQLSDPAYANSSINRLEYWLAKFVVPEVGPDRVNQAIRTLRDSRHLRTAEQHPSPEKEGAAAAARKRFGLSEFTVDYQASWDRVRAGVAGALDLIRLEVQAAQRSTTSS